MAIVGIHDFAPENGFRVDVLNAIEAHDFHPDGFTMADSESDAGPKRTITLRCKKMRADAEGGEYGPLNDIRRDVLAALDEHGYELVLFQLGDKDQDWTLTVRCSRILGALVQMRVPGA
jgi:hypothetical protein